MIRLVTDTSSMYTVADGKRMGFDVNPLLITIANQTYRDTEDISPKDFVTLIDAGNIPTSSQPIIGELLDCFARYPEDEILLLCMADGLSGTYQSALMAQQEATHPERIHVVNTQTLCGPHRYLTEMALADIAAGKPMAEILHHLDAKISTCHSFLIPQDFQFLKRGGRCTPLTARLGGLLHLVPVVMQTPDGKRLDKFVTARSFDIAVKRLVEYYQKEVHDPEKQKLYISHAFALDQAKQIEAAFKQAFPTMEIVLQELTCAFITQGGPRCLAVQSIEA